MKPTFDTHVHLWEKLYDGCVVGTLRSGKLDQYNLLLKLMEKNGIERACIVAANSPDEPKNNEFVADLCRKHPKQFVMMSEFPLLSPDRDGFDDETDFSLSLAGGLKIPLSDSIALRLEARAFLTFFDSDSSVFCVSAPPNAACDIRAESDSFLQFTTSIGVTAGF